MKINNRRHDVELASIDILPCVHNKGKATNNAVPAIVVMTIGIILE